jgi:hypothetical protein
MAMLQLNDVWINANRRAVVPVRADPNSVLANRMKIAASTGQRQKGYVHPYLLSPVVGAWFERNVLEEITVQSRQASGRTAIKLSLD